MKAGDSLFNEKGINQQYRSQGTPLSVISQGRCKHLTRAYASFVGLLEKIHDVQLNLDFR